MQNEYQLKVINKSNINLQYSNAQASRKKILLLTLMKDAWSYWRPLGETLCEFASLVKQIDCYALSNNNVEGCVPKRWENSIKDMLKIRTKGNAQCFVGQVPDDPMTISNRVYKFADLRNKCLSHALDYYGTDYDYIIIIDSDLSCKIPVQSVINAMNIKNWSSITSNTCYVNSNIYYDSFALRFIQDPTFIEDIYPDFSLWYGRTTQWLHTRYTFTTAFKVRSAFGGVSVYHAPEIIDLTNKYSNIYDLSDYPPHTCEHISLCDKLQNNILVIPDIKYHNTFPA